MTQKKANWELLGFDSAASCAWAMIDPGPYVGTGLMGGSLASAAVGTGASVGGLGFYGVALSWCQQMRCMGF